MGAEFATACLPALPPRAARHPAQKARHASSEDCGQDPLAAPTPGEPAIKVPVLLTSARESVSSRATRSAEGSAVWRAPPTDRGLFLTGQNESPAEAGLSRSPGR